MPITEPARQVRAILISIIAIMEYVVILWSAVMALHAGVTRSLERIPEHAGLVAIRSAGWNSGTLMSACLARLTRIVILAGAYPARTDFVVVLPAAATIADAIAQEISC
jgi:hypothetical protein